MLKDFLYTKIKSTYIGYEKFNLSIKKFSTHTTRMGGGWGGAIHELFLKVLLCHQFLFKLHFL